MKKLFILVIKWFGLNANDHGVWKLFGLPIMIGFYEREYYALSNFSAFQVELDGVVYQTSEHAYHVFKFDDEHIRQEIRQARSAHDAYYVAQKYKDKYRPDWHEIKAQIMKRILHAKVEQHAYVKKKLLASNNAYLVEDSWRDDFWGWGPRRSGENTLGKLWMEVRSELLEKKSL